MTTSETIRSLKLYLFDMDGTLYLGDCLFDFTKELLACIRERGARYLFMTNNSSKSVEAYIGKLARLGIQATKEDFITSSQATIHYLRQHHPDAVLYVCGTQSLIDELVQAGFAVTQNLDEVTCIVMGNDNELTFRKLEDVCKLLLLHEVDYIATNPDYVCPTEFGSVPDCGSVCDMIFNCTGRRPIFIGKPEPLMPLLGMEMVGAAKEETAVVGDRIYTDVKSGINAGTVSILVMSGETTQKILDESPDKPDMVLESGAEILRALKGEEV
ncbi:MAG: HAD-IIA family hydrolase [Clostridia bacterium]|nr:HAD-IIA family hydrolase [Clostridia bacterium]